MLWKLRDSQSVLLTAAVLTSPLDREEETYTHLLQ